MAAAVAAAASANASSAAAYVPLAPPFGVPDSTRLHAAPRLPAANELYALAAGLGEEAELAQRKLAKYLFDPVQWLSWFNRPANSPSAKAGLRCIIQAGTVVACVSGQFVPCEGADPVKLSKTALYSAVAHSRIYKLSEMPTGVHFDHPCNKDDFSKASAFQRKMKAMLLANNKCDGGHNFMVVEGDSLKVSLELKRIFRETPITMVSINPAIPGGFYRRGGPTVEEDICRRSNLWDCLQDPYHHGAKWSKLKESKHKSSNTSLNEKDLGFSSEALAARNWRYPISEGSCIYTPNVMILREPESEGYGFLRRPTTLSCICISANMVRELWDPAKVSKSFNRYTLPHLQRGQTWSTLSNRNHEMRIGEREANAYARKIELVLKVAIQEKYRIVVLGAFGCGAHGTPPKHAADIHLQVLNEVDPNGEFFDLIAFAILEDMNSYKRHNPQGNLRPFSDTFTDGRITAFEELADTPSIDECEYEYELRKAQQQRSAPASRRASFILPRAAKTVKRTTKGYEASGGSNSNNSSKHSSRYSSQESFGKIGNSAATASVSSASASASTLYYSTATLNSRTSSEAVVAAVAAGHARGGRKVSFR